MKGTKFSHTVVFLLLFLRIVDAYSQNNIKNSSPIDMSCIVRTSFTIGVADGGLTSNHQLFGLFADEGYEIQFLKLFIRSIEFAKVLHEMFTSSCVDTVISRSDLTQLQFISQKLAHSSNITELQANTIKLENILMPYQYDPTSFTLWSGIGVLTCLLITYNDPFVRISSDKLLEAWDEHLAQMENETGLTGELHTKILGYMRKISYQIHRFQEELSESEKSKCKDTIVFDARKLFTTLKMSDFPLLSQPEH